MVASRPPLSLLFEFSSDRLEECATTLQEEGEKALLQGDEKGLDLLEKAAKLDPLSPQLFHRQGLALFEYGSQHNCIATLRKGAIKFHQATTLNPKFCAAWHAWANTLALISSLMGQSSELNEAKNKIEKAAALAEAEKELAAEIHWDGALIYQKLADASGEMDDLSKAIAHFEKCAGCGDPMPHEFWSAFGRAYATLSEKLQDVRPILKSITCYKQSITLSLSNFDGWMGLGRSLKKLYQFTHENDHYLQACDCFAAASQLKPQELEVWLERIEFIIDASRRRNESGKLRVAIEKCEQAAALFAPPLKRLDFKTSVDPARWNQKPEEKTKPSAGYIHLQAYWAEALSLLGAWTNRIELIQEAERKIDQAFEASEEEDLFLINQFGKCLFSFAQYYSDLDLYYQAIEEFQTSISMDRTQLTCWVWMGATFAKVYDYTEDVDALENAIYFYKRALQIKNDPHFYYEIATLLLQLGEENQAPAPIEEALSYLEYLLQTHKSIAFDHPEWFFQYGLALDIQGDMNTDPSLHHKALEAYVNVLMFSPNHPKIHQRIGVAYCHLGDALDETDYFYRSLHHFKLASKSQVEDETLLIDWGITWMHLARHATDSIMEESSFREAEQKLLQAARLGSELVFYQLACLYSLQGSFDLSTSYLRKSHVTKNLLPLEEIMDDEWLEAVRFSPQFQEFLALLQKS